jgi:hypothetical protein
MAKSYVRLAVFCSTDREDEVDARVLEIKEKLGAGQFSPFAKAAIVEKWKRVEAAAKARGER